MVIKVYIDLMSQPSRAVLVLCKIGNIPHQVVKTLLFKGQNRTSQFGKINPFKKVPAIQDTQTGLVLAQSHAIMRYLCLKFKLDEKWYPTKDLKRQAKINQYLDYHHQGTRRIGFLLFNTILGKTIGRSDPTFNPQKGKKDAQFALKQVNNLFLKQTKFIGGEQPSIADLSAYFEIQEAPILLNFDMKNYPNVTDWMKRMGQISEIKQLDIQFNKMAALVKAKL